MTSAMEEYVIWNLGCQESLQGKFLEVSNKKINKIQQLIQIIQLKKLNVKNCNYAFIYTSLSEQKNTVLKSTHSQWLMRLISGDKIIEKGMKETKNNEQGFL
jgi:FtsZ-binding cell division protein ZapB